jgi:hypothetical protein
LLAAPVVRDPVVWQRDLQRLAREVRMSPGAGETTHVDDPSDARVLQDLHQFLGRPRAVSDGVDGRHHHHRIM